ncbi:hypothetical protein HFX_6353 (plasmid) [Haloferax mediterranei ATCC 33500]|uniref:Uncharacterized protein n=1 Tax=Haloferax mediterranei (strain ATCC 33500 / DSM 1411 / JCM 8866 / NBRC 14739 / NCIMB 2177 / R-4) TaxID=523841 RepID=I3RB64_HALMT|nr:hypothetical protein HFX_6353 [Haloferax mediterranei ATCC 33500]
MLLRRSCVDPDGVAPDITFRTINSTQSLGCLDSLNTCSFLSNDGSHSSDMCSELTYSRSNMRNEWRAQYVFSTPESGCMCPCIAYSSVLPDSETTFGRDNV